MTKPNDISQDVWDAVREALSSAGIPSTLNDYGNGTVFEVEAETIARAILAERESNARKADEQAAREEYGHAKHACVTIAQNIRNGSQ